MEENCRSQPKNFRLKVPIHSFIDVITNSSTEIFVSANESTEKMVMELLQNILKASGSEEKVEDIFTVRSEYGYYDRGCPECQDEEPEEGEDSCSLCLGCDEIEVTDKNYDRLSEQYDGDGGGIDRSIIIEGPEDFKIDITRFFQSSHTIEEDYC